MIDSDTGWYFVPASLKAVVLRGDEVMLCLNPRDEWELPGGWPDRGDRDAAATLVREVHEESGLSVTPGPVVYADILRVGPEGQVVVVMYRAECDASAEPTPGDEHRVVKFFPVDDLPEPLPELYRRGIAAARRG
ncbi:NUDIX domain-containing protein [Yinghuangia seranimata]|uniref:NUDIX domain-containing protein n=1 Tax=Yinghuangia seranimata TaxID=408067 RepID=UPI00248D022C|nr:NUDIX domain-containing protein [Yinghuangia seranimata]MDI2128499.1 NUDIX domain-containing protein [Yinghuangia seranimata]